MVKLGSNCVTLSFVGGLLALSACTSWEGWEAPRYEPLFFDQPEGFAHQVIEAEAEDDFIALGLSTGNTGCAATAGGSLRCWGDMGDRVSTEAFVQLDGGDGFMCGVTDMGEIRCWSFLPASEAQAIQVPPGANYDEVLAGVDFVCGIRLAEQWVACVSAFSDRESMIAGAVGSGRYRSFSGGNANVCGVREDQTMRCWGPTWDTDPSEVPTDRFFQVFAGDGGACATRVNGAPLIQPPRVVCWGDEWIQTRPPFNGWGIGVLGMGTDAACTFGSAQYGCWGTDRLIANHPNPAYFGIERLVVADSHACAIARGWTTGGSSNVVCWGDGRLLALE